MKNKIAVSLALTTGVVQHVHAQPELPAPAVVTVTAAAARDAGAGFAGNDTTQLLSGEPGFATAAGGGLSSIPVANGFADDRLAIRIDGMDIAAACGNHMNAPLSIVAPRQVAKIALLAGATPVSLGGDSIGGTIDVQLAPPVFASSDDTLYTAGQLSASARSVDRGTTFGAGATIANRNLSLTYDGARARGDSYRTGGGDKVLDTLYRNSNQSLLLAARGAGQTVTLRLGEQRVPYQGFPNQYMDMVDDRSRFANLGYTGTLGRTAITAKLYWQDTRHGMNNFTDEKPGMAMPMTIHGRNRGYALQADIPLDAAGRLVVGNEYHAFRLDDRWPAVPGSMMMGPDAYVRLNDGRRDRAALFGEWEYKPDARWTTLVGIRGERVTTDAGAVQPYRSGAPMDMGDMGMNMGMDAPMPMPNPDAMAAQDFNMRSRSRRDNNIDATASARLQLDANSKLEFALARKVRSPNLYERYAWGRGTMTMTMTNWFGDANGYVGNPDLKPEVATTLSGALDWHAPDHAWHVNVSPFYTRVAGYIDTDVVASFHPNMAMEADGNLLQFANHDAKLYGINLAWQATLLRDARWGQFGLKAKASVTRGRRTDGNDLYRIMPANGSVALEHALGAWASSAEAVLVDRKTRTDAHRLEPQTAGYALLNLQTDYQMSKSVRFHGGVSNVFDKRYASPLGGVYLARLIHDGMGALQPLPGYGRSVELGASASF